MDFNRIAKKDELLWNETRWTNCFNPDQGVGIFMHAGRLRGNLEWWWAQTIIYLPDGRIAVDRSWVHNPDRIGVKTPTLDLRMESEGWSARFDGIVELTSTEGMTGGPRGSSAPSVHARFDVVADGSRPLWDMYARSVGGQDFAGDMHVEQMGRSTGTLHVGTQSYSLDGFSCSDHSCGVRDMTLFHSYDFANIALPECTIHALLVLRPDGKSRSTLGVWNTPDGRQLKLEAADLPRPEDLCGAPYKFDIVLKPEGMEAQTLHVDIVHTFAYTITNDNDNINGVDWEVAGDPLICVDSQAKITAHDGSIGYATISRGDRRSGFSRKLNPKG